MAHDPLPILVHGASLDPVTIVAILHGHGDEPAGLLERFGQFAPGDMTVIAPVGPVRTPDGARAWFVSAPGDVPERAADQGTLAEAVHRLALTLGPTGNGAGRSPDAIMGYSQGAATALALTFGAAPEPRWRPGLVATVAGWLPPDPDVIWDFPGAAAHTRALLTHGADDDVVDAQMGRSAARVLARAGVDVDFEEVPGGHELGDEGILRLLAQLSANSSD